MALILGSLRIVHTSFLYVVSTMRDQRLAHIIQKSGHAVYTIRYSENWFNSRLEFPLIWSAIPTFSSRRRTGERADTYIFRSIAIGVNN